MEGPPGFREPTLGQRLLGALIDGLVLAPVATVLLSIEGWWPPLLCSVLFGAYQVGLHARDGQTLGKKVMKTRVVREESGDQIDLGRAIVREGTFLLGALAGWAIDWSGAGGLWGLIVLAPVLSPPLHQGLHDMAARTVVTSLR